MNLLAGLANPFLSLRQSDESADVVRLNLLGSHGRSGSECRVSGVIVFCIAAREYDAPLI